MKAHNLAISEIAISIARSTMIRHASTSVHMQNRYKSALERRLAVLDEGGTVILPFTRNEAIEWEKWRNHDPICISFEGKVDPVGQDVRMIIATAFFHTFELVEPFELYHSELRNQGLSVCSL